MQSTSTTALIIGASLAGLAAAACLKRYGINYVIIEKQHCIAPAWHNHYERLHLHTGKRISALPYKGFDKHVPLYPSRQQVIDYVEDYRRHFNIEPLFNTEALSIYKDGDTWITDTNRGRFTSTYVVMATGAYSRPKPIDITGIEHFNGQVLHSYAYKTGRDFAGKRVLVVGFGNSACEIAIDLHEQGALPGMSVRSSVNVVPRDMFGIPILNISLLLKRLPPRLADIISAPLIRLMMGDITHLGLAKLPYGPLEQVQRDGTPPVLDIGTIALIRKGAITMHGAIDKIDGSTVYFTNGSTADFDVIVAAIGYYRDYGDVIKVDKAQFDDLKLSTNKQRFFGKDGLYFCGYYVSPTGQIREIANDARRIAGHIARK